MNVGYRIAELREICQKTREDGSYRFTAFERHFARRLSIYITLLMYKLGISANAVSIFSLFTAITAGIFFGLGDLRFSLVGCLLAYSFIILDCVDGEVARLTDTAGGSGNVLEELAGIIFFASVLAGVGFGATRADGNPWHTIAAFVGIASTWGWSKVLDLIHGHSVIHVGEMDHPSGRTTFMGLRGISRNVFGPQGMIHVLFILVLGKCLLQEFFPEASALSTWNSLYRIEWTGVYLWFYALVRLSTLVFRARLAMAKADRAR